MEERELVAIIEDEVASAIGGGGSGASGSGASSDLANERAMELDYYNSQPFGNEREGESQVVSSDVFDAVESMLPHLLKTFTASDDAVVFEPEGREDEEAAKQRTDACNYVFYRQNNGFVVMYEWFKDALLQKNGVVKYWWEAKTEVTEDEYKGLTEGEFLMLTQDKAEVEVLEHRNYDDPLALEQRQAMLSKLSSMPRQAMPGQQIPPNPALIAQQLQAQPVPQLHDVRIKTSIDASKVCIKTIPPEEFGISADHTSISIQEAEFCHHRTKMTLSALKQMGCPDEVIEEVDSEATLIDAKPEVLARNRFVDEGGQTENPDPSLREVWVVDCFIRLDFDEDGVAELRHIIMPGKTIWINEPASHINFAALTPIIMPHRWVGKSIAEIVMDFQFMNSVLLRQMFNNLYLTNNPQKVVLGSAGGIVMADLDRLMTSRVGGILVEYAPNAIRNQEVPFVAGASFPMLEYMEGKKEQRTGNTRYNQGTDADSLNKTARGIQMIQSAAQQKVDLVARIFAETGVKDMFRGIAYMLSKYSSRKLTMRLRNKWVDIDPRQWKTQYDMTVNVGLGTGNKDAQLVHLAKMNEVQLELMKTGRGYMVTDENVYNLASKMAENMGFKHPDMFITDPKQVQKPPPQPNPDLLKIQQADTESKLKIQSNEKIRGFDAQTQKELELIKSETTLKTTAMEIASKERIVQMQLEAEAKLAIYEKHNTLDKEASELDKKQLGINYESSLLSIQKQVAQKEIADKSKEVTETLDTTKAVSDEIKKPIGELAEVVERQSKALDSVLDQQKKLASTVVVLSEKAKQPKKPKTHKVRKTAEGYEITST